MLFCWSAAQAGQPAEGITARRSGLGAAAHVEIAKAGLYQADVFLQTPANAQVKPDASKLNDKLVGAWELDGNADSVRRPKSLHGKLVGGAKFVKSPRPSGGF